MSSIIHDDEVNGSIVNRRSPVNSPDRTGVTFPGERSSSCFFVS